MAKVGRSRIIPVEKHPPVRPEEESSHGQSCLLSTRVTDRNRHTSLMVNFHYQLDVLELPRRHTSGYVCGGVSRDA